MHLFNHAEKLAALLPPLLIDAERVAASVWQGVHGRRRAGPGESFWQFRRYDVGDPAERIDWRQSARTDKIYIRTREWEAAQNACLWADASGSMHYASTKDLPTKSDSARLLMLALASLLLRGGEKPLWSEGRDFVPIQNKAGLEEIASRENGVVPLPLAGGVRGGLGVGQSSLTSLFLSRDYTPNSKTNRLASPPCPPPAPPASGRGAASFPPFPPQIRHAHMVLASDFLMPDGALQAAMQVYAAQDFRGALLHVVDPLEASFDLDGRVELRGAEGEDALVLPSASGVRDAYRQRFAEHQARLLHIAESANWFYLRHVTSDSPQQTLLKLYQYLAG